MTPHRHAALDYTSPTPATDALAELARLQDALQAAAMAFVHSFDGYADAAASPELLAARQAERALRQHQDAFL